VKKLIYADGISNIKFNFAGKSCPEFTEAIEENQLTSFIDEKGFLPHHESTKILQTADILLLVVDDVPNNKGFLTGKIFEYLGAKKPIFAIGPIDGNANDILNETRSGEMIDYNDREGAYELLKNMYRKWNDGSLDYEFNVDQYSRKKQAEQLANIFEEQII